jgi:hypothetical protein
MTKDRARALAQVPDPRGTTLAQVILAGKATAIPPTLIGQLRTFHYREGTRTFSVRFGQQRCELFECGLIR